ncbi:hypothetical protein [Pseudonocardia nigra]|nr:hypothetical protein [Pseudonocardia nigra]
MGVLVAVLFALAVASAVWLSLTQVAGERQLHAVGGNAEVTA